MNPFFKEIYKISGSKTFTAVVMFVIGIILARVLGPEGRGLYAAVLVVPMIVINFAELGIKRSTIYHIARKTYKDEEVISATIMTIVISSVLGIIVCALFYYFLDRPEFTIPLIILAVARIPFRVFRDYVGGIFLGREEYNRTIFLQWLFVIVYLLLTILFLVIFKFNVLGALISLIASNFILSIVSLIILIKSDKIILKTDFKIVWEIIRLGLVYSAAIFIMKLHTKIDILLLNQLSDLEQVGFYSVGTRLAEKWQIPFSIGGIIIAKSAVNTDFKALNADFAKLIRLTFFLSLVSMIILYFASPYVIPILYGKKWIGSIGIVQMILPGILMLIVARVMGSRLAGMGKPYIFMFIAIPALVLNIILNYLWIPEHGGLGAAMATNISYSLMTIAGVIVYAQVVEQPLKEIILFQRSDFALLPKIIRKTIKKLRK